jgi:hypothetical protein
MNSNLSIRLRGFFMSFHRKNAGNFYGHYISYAPMTWMILIGSE